MKKRIISSLCALAVMAYASLSWGGQIYSSSNMNSFDVRVVGAPLTWGDFDTSLTSSITANGVVQPGSEFQQVFAIGYDMVAPSSASIAGSLVPDYSNVDGSLAATVNSATYADAIPQPSPDFAIQSDVNVYALNPVGGSVSAMTSTTYTQNFLATGAAQVWIGAIIDLMSQKSLNPGETDFTGSALHRIFFNVSVAGTSIFSYDSGTYGGDFNSNGGLLVSYINTPSWFTVANGDPVVLSVRADAQGNASIPEPSTFILAGSGLLGMFFLRRRNKVQA